MSIDKTAAFHLSLFYGDKDKCLLSLNQTLTKYKNSPNARNPKLVERIAKYEKVIAHLEKPNP